MIANALQSIPVLADENIWSAYAHGMTPHRVSSVNAERGLCGVSIGKRWTTYHVDPARGSLATPSIGTPCAACVAKMLADSLGPSTRAADRECIAAVSRTTSSDRSIGAVVIAALDATLALPIGTVRDWFVAPGTEQLIRDWAGTRGLLVVDVNVPDGNGGRVDIMRIGGVSFHLPAGGAR